MKKSVSEWQTLSASTTSATHLRSGVTSKPRLRTMSATLRSVLLSSESGMSRFMSRRISSSSTSMTWEKWILFQTFSAFSRSSMTIMAPLSAPTDVPDTAEKRMPASRRAFHAPIW